MGPLRIIGSIFGTVAFVLAAVCIWSINDARSFTDNALRTEGVVVRLDYNRRAAAAVIQYQVEGREFHISTKTASSPPAYSVGEKVTVLYLPGEPEEGQVESFWEQYLLAVITGSLALVFSLVFLVTFGIPYLKERRRRLAFSMGAPVTAKVVEVRLDSSLTVLGKNPWVIVGTFTDTEGTEHNFVSQYLWTSPKERFPVGSDVTVYYLPEKPSVYAFDLDRGQSQ